MMKWKEVMSAMAREFRGSGHWYTCVNGHPFTVGECGMPMEQARCSIVMLPWVDGIIRLRRASNEQQNWREDLLGCKFEVKHGELAIGTKGWPSLVKDNSPCLTSNLHPEIFSPVLLLVRRPAQAYDPSTTGASQWNSEPVP